MIEKKQRIETALNRDSFKLLCDHGLIANLIRSEIVEEKIDGVLFEAEDKEAIIQSIKAQIGAQSEEDLKNWAIQNKTTLKDIIESRKYNYLYAKYCLINYKNKAEARFLSKKIEMDKAIYSVIRVHDPFKARELALQIREGEASFGDLAASHSEGPEKNTRGIVGPVSLKQSHPAITEILRSCKENEVRGPIQVSEWNVILRLEKLIPAIYNQSAEVELTKELFEEELIEEIKEQLTILKKTFS